jgi:hypothetical protein
MAESAWLAVVAAGKAKLQTKSVETRVRMHMAFSSLER